jgi:curli biogenesis system outer membrane secretion channel CsgG
MRIFWIVPVAALAAASTAAAQPVLDGQARTFSDSPAAPPRADIAASTAPIAKRTRLHARPDGDQHGRCAARHSPPMICALSPRLSGRLRQTGIFLPIG